MANSAIEFQLADGVKFSSSDPYVVAGVLACQLAVSAIRSIPTSQEPAYFGGNIYEPEADRAAMEHVRKR